MSLKISCWLGALMILSTPVSPQGRQGPQRTSPPSAAETVVLDGNAFAWDLYRRVSRTPGNVCLCPHGVRQSLAALAAGADLDTAKELARALGLTLPGEVLHPAMRDVRRSLLADGRGEGADAPVLCLATGVWTSPAVSIQVEYRKLLETYHGASWRSVDFAREPNAAREAIRAFVEDGTKGRIHDFLPEELPDEATALLLVHATYFRGTWQYEFEESATKQEPFHLSARESVDVPLMHQEETFRCAERASFHAVELPYQGEGAGSEPFSMVVIVPKALDGLQRLESSLRFDDLQSVLSSLRPREVQLSLPRFRIESDLDLRRELVSLGVRRAFHADASPFANMTSAPVYLDSVRQRARVSADEQGTEATAVIEECIIVFGASTPAVVRADRPFLFLIRHRKTGTILFLGRVADPRS